MPLRGVWRVLVNAALKIIQNMGAKNRFSWPNALLIAALFPMFSLYGITAWFFAYWRPSGNEQWGDGAILFIVGAFAIPGSALLVLSGILWTKRICTAGQVSMPSTTKELTVFAAILVAVPIVLVLTSMAMK